MVADNDLALGRIVERITKSHVWASSLILVTEDDAQDGVDHVDGHRTVALAIGPYVRRDVVDSNNYNHTSMIRTIQEIFRIPQRTRFLGSGAPHDQHLHGEGRPHALRTTGAQGGARRDESAGEGARGPALVGRAAIDGNELRKQLDDAPAETLNQHFVVGRQRVEYAVP